MGIMLALAWSSAVMATGEMNAIDPRMVNGVEALPGEFPSIVSLVADELEGFVCGGALLSKNRVLTAAHCVTALEERDLTSLKVRAGSVVSRRKLSGLKYE